jgi:hypothetical protein
MNNNLNVLLNSIKTLNSFDMSSLLWTLNYQASASIINKTVSLIPDAPAEGSGIEGFTQHEYDLRNIDLESVAPYIALKKELDAICDAHTDGTLPIVANTAAFLKGRVPTRLQFINEFNARKLSGAPLRIKMKDFVNVEFAGAMQRYGRFVSKCEQAMDIVEAHWDSTGNTVEIDVSDDYVDMLADKLRPKLLERWTKSEIRVTSPRLNDEARIEARQAQLAIEYAMEEFGVAIPEVTEYDDSGDAAFEQAARSLDTRDALSIVH